MKHLNKYLFIPVLSAMALCLLVACGDSSDDNDDDSAELKTVYEFTDANGDSTISYSGQVARLTLINELNSYISSGLQADIESEAVTSKQDVLDKLNGYYTIEDAEGNNDEAAYTSIPVTTVDNAEQQTLGDISSSFKNLLGKLAGNDTSTDHKDWAGANGDSAFEGWTATGVATPDDLVQYFFGLLADNAVEAMSTDRTVNFGGQTDTAISVYVTADGLDLKQLIQKFLLGGVAFSQGTDDYLDNDVANKGLMNTNATVREGQTYTELEHAWDEGFGYFGAARDYLDYTDEEIAGRGGREEYETGSHDSNEDGVIDLISEHNTAASTNAAKRDLGSTSGTDFTDQAMRAFLAGRQLINENIGQELTEQQMTDLVEHRDNAVDAWEKAISATVIHYINNTRADLERLQTEDAEFSYSDLVKHWGEMKGFALGLQFNPNSSVSDADFTTIMDLMGERPELETGAIEDYRADLLEARDILEAAYGFESEDVAEW